MPTATSVPGASSIDYISIMNDRLSDRKAVVFCRFQPYWCLCVTLNGYRTAARGLAYDDALSDAF
jgi:hypothetical protein